MKFRDPKTGEVLEDINDCCDRKCSERAYCGEWCPLHLKGLYCKLWARKNPAAAARIMGYEIVEEEEMEQTDKPRICEVLGGKDNPLEIGEAFIVKLVSGFVIELQVNSCGEVGCWDNANRYAPEDVVFYAINHPESIIRKPRFTQEEVAFLKNLSLAGINYIRREDAYITLWEAEPKPKRGRMVGDGLIPAKAVPGLRIGQVVALSDVVG